MERRLRGCGGWPLGLGFLSVLVVFGLGALAQTNNVTVKRTPKKTMEGSSDRTAPSSVFDVFMVSSLGSRGVWLTEA